MKHRKPMVLAAAVTVVFSVFFAASIRRVPPGEQALCVTGGSSRVYRTGTHFVRPFSGTWMIYPAGPVEQRYPAEGAFGARTSDGYEVRVAVRLQLDVRPGSAAALYKRFGEDFETGVTSVVREAVEIQTANRSVLPGGAMPDGYGEAVLADVMETMNAAGIAVGAYRFEDWGVSGEAPTATPAPLHKVVFVGTDGADWDIIEPMIAEGRLPHFKRLVDGGTTGRLRSIEPLLSPLIWTTMATGKPPEEHGILNFTVVDPETGAKVPISRRYRKVDAFWNMLSDFGRSVDIVGWLATYPAESIHGVMVTDRLGYLAYAESGDAPPPASVSPPDRIEETYDLVMKSDRVSYEEFQPFVRLDRETFFHARSTAFDPKDPVNGMIMIYASTQSYHRIACHLLERDQPDFLGVYFELVDATGHLFMHYAPPRLPDIDEEDYDRFKGAVASAYILQDRIIGEIMDRCDENTVLIVASDHGFKSGRLRPKSRPEIWAGKAAFWHEPEGILCIYGAGIRRGHRIDGASILDITPTILALQGLPVPEDMGGKALEGAFEPELVSRLNRMRVATLERERNDTGGPREAGDESADNTLKKLEALGYITPDNPDAHNNLGQRYQKQREYDKAIEEFERALAIRPNFPAALNNLGVCYGSIKRYDLAEQVFRKALGLNPSDVYAMNNLAVMFLHLGKLGGALQFSKQSVTVEPNYANGHLTLGSVYATMGEFEKAEREYLQTLEIDPSNESARANLQKLQRNTRGSR